MSFIGNVIASLDKKKQLKAIEQAAFEHQKEIQCDVAWEEAKCKAEANGVKKAQTTPSERLKTAVNERKEKVKERKAKLVVDNPTEKPAKREMSSLIIGAGNKDMSSLVTKRNTGSMLTLDKK